MKQKTPREYNTGLVLFQCEETNKYFKAALQYSLENKLNLVFRSSGCFSCQAKPLK